MFDLRFKYSDVSGEDDAEDFVCHCRCATSDRHAENETGPTWNHALAESLALSSSKQDVVEREEILIWVKGVEVKTAVIRDQTMNAKPALPRGRSFGSNGGCGSSSATPRREDKVRTEHI
jgi:hypothetical protein